MRTSGSSGNEERESGSIREGGEQYGTQFLRT